MIAEVMTDFVKQINDDKEYTLSDLKKILTDVYKNKVQEKKDEKKPAKVVVYDVKKADNADNDDSDEDKPKKRGRPPSKPKLDKNGEVKQKKAPSAYNNFVKAKIQELKPLNPDKTARDMMLIAAAQWKELTKEEQEKYKTVQTAQTVETDSD
ncbi:HMG-box domain-containing protein [Flavobacterium sp.]|jgi:hypothetical protein|uniref:HMG-box domain-containing protein n=1 Tax=Flavobacterium sp. TaxID=239 RepID=UPI0037BF997E